VEVSRRESHANQPAGHAGGLGGTADGEGGGAGELPLERLADVEVVVALQHGAIVITVTDIVTTHREAAAAGGDKPLGIDDEGRFELRHLRVQPHEILVERLAAADLLPTHARDSFLDGVQDKLVGLEHLLRMFRKSIDGGEHAVAGSLTDLLVIVSRSSNEQQPGHEQGECQNGAERAIGAAIRIAGRSGLPGCGTCAACGGAAGGGR
jgi:hypothetical protein